MIVDEKYLGTGELQEVLNLCKALDEAFLVFQQNDTFVRTDFLEDANGYHRVVKVRDCNGDILGYIGFTESGGFGFYPDNGDGKEYDV